jgi:septal ring factor EnvC (AmiA/AmiB activator)
MKWLSSLKNQTVLLALVGLCALNGLLCAVMILRENSNATQIVRLESEAKVATQSQQTKSAELNADLDVANSKIANLSRELEKTAKDLAKAQIQINKTAADLADTSNSLKSAVDDLQSLAGIVANFRNNNPWLTDTKQRPPWDVQIEKLLKDRKK